MKILFVLIRMKGGVGRVVNEITEELMFLGHKYDIISREDELKIFSFRGSGEALRKAVCKKKYDILFTQDWSIAYHFLGFPNHYCLFHGISPSFLGRLFQNYVARKLKSNLFVVSNRLLKEFPKAYVMENSVNKKKFHPIELKSLKKEKVGYINFGYDCSKSKKKAKEIAENNGLEVSVAKGLTFDEMNYWYNQLKVFVSLPPRCAGFNLSWLEARASGVPVIVGNDNGIGIKNLHKYIDRTWADTVEKLLNIWEFNEYE